MRPLFATLKSHHHSSETSGANYKSGEDLYSDIGYDINKFIMNNSDYGNTCAARMSLALLSAGVPFTGRLEIKKGIHKGRLIETGAKLLADQLNKSSSFGKVTTVTDAKTASKLLDQKKAVRFIDAKLADQSLEGRQGVIFFWKFDNYSGGHIDLLEFRNRQNVCNSNCYFHVSHEVWFWPLD